MYKIILKNFSSLILAQGFYKILTFFVLIFSARFLGVDKFGELSYCLSFVWIIIFVSDFGLS
ncbi:MAG: oligosaccharide flippase family protein, partial [Candidatus Omnitrophica bacterium]|nr:oligosaccharide flippase family protein [Candidatus Omnitrophota bacterium]